MNHKTSFGNISQQAAVYHTLLILDNSTNASNFTSFVFSESHYPTHRGIIRLMIQTSLRSFSASLII